VEIYTIGFTKKSAEVFFEILKQTSIKHLIDVRLHNQSQLAGFAKQKDLKYFLWELCGAKYRHELGLAPSEDILEDYRHKKMDWEKYQQRFFRLLKSEMLPGICPERPLKFLLCCCAANRRLTIAIAAWWRHISRRLVHWLQINNLHFQEQPVWQLG